MGGAHDGRRYVPAIDGLRALAVGSVLAFHSELMHAPGGFLGVSLFFTVSGFLITTLLLDEHASHGRIQIRAFWGRRYRRLLPAALLTIVGVALVAPHLGEATQQSLRGDLFAAVGNVANWRILSRGAHYADLFAAPSPVLHFWSLAIEEQFYIVFPLLVAAVLRRRGDRRVLGCVLGTLACASVAWQFVLHDVDRVYLGTDTRAAELLAGALLAIALAGRGAPGPRARRAWSVAAAAGLAAFGVLVVTTSDRAEWLGRGGFALVALVSVALIGGAVADVGALGFLAWGPLVAIGRVSYGIYLFHWPVFVWLDEHRTGLRGVALLAVRLAVVAVLTIVSYHVLECPVRYKRVFSGARTLMPAAALALAFVVLVTVTLPIARPEPLTDPSVLAPLLNAPAPVARMTSAPAPLPKLRVMIVGDESGGRVAWQLAARPGNRFVIDNATRPQCPVDQVTLVRHSDSDVPYHAVCYDWPLRWRAEARLFRPDLVVVSSIQELNEMGTNGRDYADLSSPPWYDETVNTFDSAAAQLRSDGAMVAWASAPASAGPRVDLLNRVIGVVVRRELGVVRFDATNVSAKALVHAYRAARVELGLDAPDGARRPVRVLVVGDSTSLNLAAALAARGLDRGDVRVDWAGQVGCPIAPVAKIRKIGESAVIDAADCRSAGDLWRQHIALFKPDVVLVVSTYMECADVQRAPDGPWEHVGDPEFDAFVSAQFDAAVEVASAGGTRVAWATAPLEDAYSPSATPELRRRLTRLNELIGELGTRRRRLTIVPLALRVDRPDAVVDLAARPDGVHFTIGAARVIVDGWLAATLVAIGRHHRPVPRSQR